MCLQSAVGVFVVDDIELSHAGSPRLAFPARPVKTIVILLAVAAAILGGSWLYSTAPAVSDWSWNDVLSGMSVAFGAVAAILALFQLLTVVGRSSKKQDEIYEELRKTPPIVPLAFPNIETYGDSQVNIDLGKLHEVLQADAEREDELRIVSLWSQAQNRLDLYQRLAKSQSTISFWMLMLIATSGFVLVGVVAWQAAQSRTTTGGLTAGAVGIVGAGLAGYIGRTFQQTYREATRRLIDYFEQPLQLTRLLAAERLLRRLSGPSADNAVTMIIQAALGVESHRNSNTSAKESSGDILDPTS